MRYKRRVLLIVIQILVILLCVEVYFRIFRPAVYFSSLEQPHNDYNHTYTPNCEGRFIMPDDGYAFSCRYNSMGLCQKEEVVIPKPPGVYRILVMGDSFVAGLKEDTRISFTLGKAFSGVQTASGKRVEFVNCGQSSYSPLLHLARLKNQYMRFEPDAIILMPDLTDVFDDNFRYRQLTRFDKDGNLEGVSPPPLLLQREKAFIVAGFYATNSYLVRAIVKKILVRFSEPEGDNYKEIRSRYLFTHCAHGEDGMDEESKREVEYAVSNIRKVVDFAKANKINIAIATYPHLAQIMPIRMKNEKGMLRCNRFFEREIEKLCLEESVPYHSFYDEIAREVRSGRTLYFKYNIHLNEEGQKVLSDRIVRWILKDPKDTIGTYLTKSG